MKNHYRPCRRHQSLFLLLAVSFFSILLLAGNFWGIRGSVNHVNQVQQQSAFRTTLAILPKGNDMPYSFAIDKVNQDWLLEIPRISDGILAAVAWYSISDTMPYYSVQYCFGALEQLQLPLLDGTKTAVEQGERKLYAGVSFLPYIREREQGECLNIGGEWIPVAGVLDDITGSGEDDRLIFAGGDYMREIERLLRRGDAQFYYYTNKDGGEEELGMFLDWLKEGGGEMPMGEPCIGRPWQPVYAPDDSDSVLLVLVKKATYPMFGCCIAGCLLILYVYVKKRKDDFLIRRMLGTAYVQLALSAGKDYLIILMPAAVLAGLCTHQILQTLCAASALLLFFVAVSFLMIKIGLRREGGCL